MSSLEIGHLFSTINVANGAGVSHKYFNATDKVMKYITFTYVPYNSVGDQVSCTISGKAVASGKLTGPIEPYHEDYLKWESLWYNPTVSKVELVQVQIDYMDGSQETIDGKDIVDMESEGSVYCEKIKKPREAARVEQERKAAEERAERERKAAEERAERERKAAEEKAERERKVLEEKQINDRKNELVKAYTCFKVFSCFKSMKNDDEMKFHVNQGLWLFILEVIGVIFGASIPGIGSIIFLVAECLALFLSVKSIKEIRDGKRFEIPVISKIRLIK